MKKLLFLGGTVGQNNWREGFIKSLKGNGVKDEAIFNPVVKDWNEEAQDKEEIAKKAATHMMFYLGSPKEPGIPVSAYSLVEATMSLYDKPKTTVVVFDQEGIEGHSLKAYKQTEKVLKKRFPDAHIFSTPKEALSWLANSLNE
jgi:hypothetical protein